MNYIGWTLVALAAYTVFPPLVSVATRDIPSNVTTLVATTTLALTAAGVVVFEGERVGPYLVHEDAPFMYLAGLALAVGVLAYYYALSVGPVSVVVPIFGMFIVTSSIIGVALLGETLTVRKGAGLAFAALAVYLIAVG